jgi:hypothetical protein
VEPSRSRSAIAAAMETRRQGELEEEFKAVRRGWCLGSEAFGTEMRNYIETQGGKWHYGPQLRESGKAKAERLRLCVRRTWISQAFVDHWRAAPCAAQQPNRLREGRP